TARGTLLEQRAAAVGLLHKKQGLEQSVTKVRDDSLPRSLDVVVATRKAYDTGHVSLSDLILVERSHRDLTVNLIDLAFDLFSAGTEILHTLGLDAVLARGAPGTSTKEEAP